MEARISAEHYQRMVQAVLLKWIHPDWARHD